MFGWTSDPNSWENPFRPYNLATAKFSAWCYDKLYAQPEVQYTTAPSMPMGSGMGMPGMGMAGPMGPGGGPTVAIPAFTGPSQGDFINVAHSLWALLLAACGGWLARWLYATGPAKKQTEDAAESRG